MKKETEKAEESSSLDEKIKLSARDACGSAVRAFDCINDLENVSEIRKDNPGADGSGFIRADVMNSFLLSINELIGSCEMHFAMHEQPNLAMLRYFEPEKDRFLQLLNEKKFDGICDDAGNLAKQKQYMAIRQSYTADREAVVNNCYISYLEKKSQKKHRLWPFYLWGASLTAICLGIAAFQAASYIQIKSFEKKAENMESTFYESAKKLEQNLKPENIIKSAEDYFKSREGQEYIDSKYTQFKAWWAKENLAADQFDVFWEKKIKPVVEEFNSAESDQRRAKYIVDLLEQEYGLKTTVEEIARIFGKKK